MSGQRKNINFSVIGNLEVGSLRAQRFLSSIRRGLKYQFLSGFLIQSSEMLIREQKVMESSGCCD